MSGAPLLEVRELTVRLPDGTPVVESVAFDVGTAEVVALLGESGAGKSTCAGALVDLLPTRGARVSGSVRFEGRELVGASRAELRAVRGAGIGYLFQDVAGTLDPVFSVGFQLEEALTAHRRLPRSERRARALALLARVRLPDPPALLACYPHELSGGMRQRVALALALAGGPRLLIADEPTTGLDAPLKRHLVDLLADLRAELGLSVLLVTHDLDAVAALADRALVLVAGQLVERAPVSRLVASPRHPATAALLGAWPRPGVPLRPGLSGEPPVPGRWPAGCRFRPRCPRAVARCALEAPPEVGGVRCFAPLDGDAP